MVYWTDFKGITKYAVEANSFERHVLWGKNNNLVKWTGRSEGWGVLVEGGGFVSLIFDYLNDQPILFYEVTSDTVVHSIVNKWLHDNFELKYNVDADNFHQVIHDVIRE